MVLVARRRMKTIHGQREIGDPVPEAAEWRNLNTYLRLGWVVDDPTVTADESTAGQGGEGDLSSLTVADLKAKAKEAGLTGYSKLSKPKLIAALS